MLAVDIISQKIGTTKQLRIGFIFLAFKVSSISRKVAEKISRGVLGKKSPVGFSAMSAQG